MKVVTQYYENGVIKAKGQLLNDCKEGKWIYYYETGSKCREVNFINDLENGEWQMWHENGNLYLEQNKKNGRSDGYWKEYYESGLIKEVGIYDNEEYSPIDFWDVDGNQLLKKGTGLKIEMFGSSELDIYEIYYQDYVLIKEVKISSANFGKFNSY